MITKLGFRIPKLVVPIQPEAVGNESCKGYSFSFLAKSLTCFRYALLPAEYLPEQDEKTSPDMNAIK